MNTAIICQRCGIQLPLKTAGENEYAEMWLCRNCGRENRGLLDQAARPAIRDNCQPMEASVCCPTPRYGR